MDEFKDASPLPWTVDKSGAVLDANGEQVGSLMPARRAQNAALVTRAVGAITDGSAADGGALAVLGRIADYGITCGWSVLDAPVSGCTCTICEVMRDALRLLGSGS